MFLEHNLDRRFCFLVVSVLVGANYAAPEFTTGFTSWEGVKVTKTGFTSLEGLKSTRYKFHYVTGDARHRFKKFHKKSFIIYGIKDQQNETEASLRKHVIDLFTEHMSTFITEGDLRQCYRLSPDSFCRPGESPVVVSFTTDHRREEFLYQEYHLREAGFTIEMGQNHRRRKRSDDDYDYMHDYEHDYDGYHRQRERGPTTPMGPSTHDYKRDPEYERVELERMEREKQAAYDKKLKAQEDRFNRELEEFYARESNKDYKHDTTTHEPSPRVRKNTRPNNPFGKFGL